MNGFVALVDALAWPLATLAIGVLFRRELRMAMGRLGQVKYAGMELTFREDLRQAEALVKSIPRAEPSGGAPVAAKIQLEAASGDTSELVGTLVSHETSTTMLAAASTKHETSPPRNLESYFRVCQGSPRLGILEAWDDLGRALIHASTVLGDRRAPVPLRIESAIRFLAERGWINGTEAQLTERLRRLAETVDRREGSPLTYEDAHRFVELAVPLLERVARLT